MFPENRKNIITYKARQIHQQPAIFVQDFKIKLKYVNICWTLSDTINTPTFSIENNIYRLFASAFYPGLYIFANAFFRFFTLAAHIKYNLKEKIIDTMQIRYFRPL